MLDKLKKAKKAFEDAFQDYEKRHSEETYAALLLARNRFYQLKACLEE